MRRYFYYIDNIEKRNQEIIENHLYIFSTKDFSINELYSIFEKILKQLKKSELNNIVIVGILGRGAYKYKDKILLGRRMVEVVYPDPSMEDTIISMLRKVFPNLELIKYKYNFDDLSYPWEAVI